MKITSQPVNEQSLAHRRASAEGLDPKLLEKAILADCRTYYGEQRNVFIGTDRYLAKQFLDSVGKNNTINTYCKLEGDFCNLPAHIQGFDRLGRPIKSLPMIYIGELILLLQNNNKITVTTYCNDEQQNQVVYERKDRTWYLTYTFDSNTARVINNVFTLKPDCRKRIAEQLGVEASGIYHEMFRQITDRLSQV